MMMMIMMIEFEHAADRWIERRAPAGFGSASCGRLRKRVKKFKDKG